MKFTTESGTEYEYDDTLQRVRRLGGDPMRGDGEWLKLLHTPAITIGKPVRFMLEPLGGPGTFATERTTTPVTRIGLS